METNLTNGILSINITGTDFFFWLNFVAKVIRQHRHVSLQKIYSFCSLVSCIEYIEIFKQFHVLTNKKYTNLKQQ